MRIFEWKRFVLSMLVGLSLCCGGAIRAFADDDGKDSPPAKPVAAAKVDAPAPLTERERLLLDRVEQLEKRMADLEAKGHPAAPSSSEAAAASQPSGVMPATAQPGVGGTGASGEVTTAVPAAAVS